VNELQIEHDWLKANLLLEGTQAHIPIHQMSSEIDCIGEMIRMVQQWLKAVKRMKELQDQLGIVTATQLMNVDHL